LDLHIESRTLHRRRSRLPPSQVPQELDRPSKSRLRRVEVSSWRTRQGQDELGRLRRSQSASNHWIFSWYRVSFLVSSAAACWCTDEIVEIVQSYGSREQGASCSDGFSLFRRVMAKSRGCRCLVGFCVLHTSLCLLARCIPFAVVIRERSVSSLLLLVAKSRFPLIRRIRLVPTLRGSSSLISPRPKSCAIGVEERRGNEFGPWGDWQKRSEREQIAN